MTPRNIADEPDYEPITSLDQFRERVSGQFGVIVIDDHAREQPIVHHRECPYVSEEHFVEKVVKDKARNGHYFWVKNSSIAKREFKARPCKHSGDKLKS